MNVPQYHLPLPIPVRAVLQIQVCLCSFYPGLVCSFIRTPLDPEFEANPDDTDAITFDSIFLTTPPSLPRLPDLPLPPSSSQSSTSLLWFSHQTRPTTPSTCTDSHSFSPEDMGTRTLSAQHPWFYMLMFSILSDHDVTTPDANSQILDSSLSPQASPSECLCDSHRMDR